MIDRNDLVVSQECSQRNGQIVGCLKCFVTVTHKPTGLSATSSSERNQHLNREKAISILEAELKRRAQEVRA